LRLEQEPREGEELENHTAEAEETPPVSNQSRTEAVRSDLLE